ncbi:hypothetical protein GCM10027589_10170 [Actinocorallia lasiicapitis]
MHLIAARLTGPHPAPEPAQVKRHLLRAQAGVDLQHARVRGDPEGLCLVLFIRAESFPAAKSGALRLLACSLTDHFPAGWRIAHCGEALTAPALDLLE